MTFDGRKNFLYTYNCLDLLSGIILDGRVPVVIYDWLSDGAKVADYARGVDRFNTRIYKGSFTYGSSAAVFELESVSYGGGQFVMTGTGSAQRLSP